MLNPWIFLFKKKKIKTTLPVVLLDWPFLPVTATWPSPTPPLQPSGHRVEDWNRLFQPSTITMNRAIDLPFFISFLRSICIPPSWPASPRVCALSDCLALSAWWLHLSARSSVRWNKTMWASLLSLNDAPFLLSYCFLQSITYCGPNRLHVLLCWVNYCWNLFINYGWFYIQT